RPAAPATGTPHHIDRRHPRHRVASSLSHGGWRRRRHPRARTSASAGTWATTHRERPAPGCAQHGARSATPLRRPSAHPDRLGPGLRARAALPLRAEVPAGGARLREQGFRIALDDLRRAGEPDLPPAPRRRVGIDLRDVGDRGRRLLDVARSHGGILIAERVESAADWDPRAMFAAARPRRTATVGAPDEPVPRPTLISRSAGTDTALAPPAGQPRLPSAPRTLVGRGRC
ncbi:MAG: hypothetical protein JWP95_2219, partial [Actinotalea sp.]|nr:hypothetical protein [Actinotalea sp.]